MEKRPGLPKQAKIRELRDMIKDMTKISSAWVSDTGDAFRLDEFANWPEDWPEIDGDIIPDF